MNKLQKKLIRLLAVLTATVMLAACGSEASVSPDTSEPAQTPGTTAAKETPETTVPETVSQAETPEETTAPAETEENHEAGRLPSCSAISSRPFRRPVSAAPLLFMKRR